MSDTDDLRHDVDPSAGEGETGEPLRVLVTGQGSFIARHLLPILARGRGLAVKAVGHREAEAAVARGDAGVLINCALDPAFRRADYDPDHDMDLRLARRFRGTHMIMLSSRKVYGPRNDWPAREAGPALGADAYGRNKAITERALQDDLGDRLTVLRLSNVAGFEYPEPGRRTFMALVLSRLKQDGVIHYDMDPAQERDFVPLDRAVAFIVGAVRSGPGGILNAGSGIPLATGDLARWIMDGFGGGRLTVEDRGIQDRFVLDMARTHAAFPHLPPLTRADLERHFKDLGARLRAAPFTAR
ncbi:MAG: NAD-dependent epimerase/dehydratase family protein [Alphaproteobacteria bacterium]